MIVHDNMNHVNYCTLVVSWYVGIIVYLGTRSFGTKHYTKVIISVHLSVQ